MLFVRGCIRLVRFRRSSSVSPAASHLPPGGRVWGHFLPYGRSSLSAAGGDFYAAPLIRHGYRRATFPPRLRRATFPPGEGFGGISCRMGVHPCPLLAVTFTLHPSSVTAIAVPPSPEGEGFGAVELGRCRGKLTWAAGACPRPTVTFTLHPSSVTAIAVPPSPEGEGFGAVELGRCRGKLTWAAGACPRPTKGTFLLPQTIEPYRTG